MPNEPARQSFIVRPRVRDGVAVAGIQDSGGAGGACVNAAPLPASSTADADPSRLFPASYQSHQPSRISGLSFAHMGRGYSYRKQGPSHAPSGKIRGGLRSCVSRPGGAFLIHWRISGGTRVRHRALTLHRRAHAAGAAAERERKASGSM